MWSRYAPPVSEERAPAQPVRDPTVLRGLAHPVRARIVDEMYATGPVRAADVARDLGIPANQASFHLRQLAKYGLVEEAPDAGRDRRDRVWQLTAQTGLSIDVGDLAALPGGQAAVDVWRQQASAWAHGVVDAAYHREPDDAVTVHIATSTVRLTKDEAARMAAELDDVVQTWADRTRGRDGDRSTYALLSVLQPYPES
ncbi:Helix-turn-helix domain-containing protein [Klenkia brasiliensis]|uniref:Helix-turn-helix domain-containing protein n=1 Tax=Klenkia brasiliensis TaxID=333142 RepID=A0A1G7Q0U7_9ACTN|nr:Helix-turn-helix domain-containing protein [Klenkia brasiliensis]